VISKVKHKTHLLRLSELSSQTIFFGVFCYSKSNVAPSAVLWKMANNSRYKTRGSILGI